MENVAVIDTGTNSTRLIIAAVEDGIVRELHRQTVITRLGEGVDSNNLLGNAARARVVACISDFAASIDEHDVRGTLLIATSSVRDADDGPEFIEGLARQYGFEHKVLSGEEEAELSFAGAATGLNEAERILLADIGGGSTEIAIGTSSKLEIAVSLRLGCVRLRERYFHSDPPDVDELQQARLHVEGVIRDEIAPRIDDEINTAIAVAGTMTTLAAIDLGLKRYDRHAVHGHRLSADRIGQLLRQLSAMSLAERQVIEVMEKGRADVIVAGALIADVLIKSGRFEEFTVSENDILVGAVLEFYRRMT